MSLSRTHDPGQSKDNPDYSELIKDELSVFCGIKENYEQFCVCNETEKRVMRTKYCSSVF